MKMEKTKDEIRMNWNKKVSMREIAQFYEEKLRELDSKQSLILSDLKNRLDGLSRIIQENEEKANWIDKWVSQFSGEANNQIREMRSILKEFKEETQNIKVLEGTFFEDNFINSRTAIVISQLTYDILFQYIFLNHKTFYVHAKKGFIKKAREGELQDKSYLNAIHEIPGIDWNKISKKIDERVARFVEQEFSSIEEVYEGNEVD